MELLIAPNTVPQASRDTMPATGTPGWATDGDPALNIPATGDLACHYNMMMAEIVQAILDAGMALDRTNWGQLSAAIQKFVANETLRATTIESNLQTSKQDILGFTPVQQGGGANQGTNKVFLGFDSAGSGRARLQVDATDKGTLAYYADLVAIAASGIASGNGCIEAPVGSGISLLFQWVTFQATTGPGGSANGSYETNNISVTWPRAFSTFLGVPGTTVFDIGGIGMGERCWVMGAPSESGGDFRLACNQNAATMTGNAWVVGIA
ncbi:hypothetical protein [Gluconacetobacter azotocaptans]|uniref:hypothetical protein n=1 Tax=Gluconacetobacter azotocaptans TaxID=142834 RepID=UPI001FD3CB01|nr:hypothetical protein [Gluconacetobacter azotocaptans]GBQ32309.1 hypothetical protein AA13594_2331 [Gluconacetobacter azotocaptans DSM 13594]